MRQDILGQDIFSRHGLNQHLPSNWFSDFWPKGLTWQWHIGTKNCYIYENAKKQSIFLWIRLLHSAFLFDSTHMNITLNYVFWKDLAQMLCVFFYGHTLYGIRKCSSSALRSSRSFTWGAKWIGHLLMLLFCCQILWPIIWQPIRYAGR